MADVVKEYIDRMNRIRGLQVRRQGGDIAVKVDCESEDPRLAIKEIRGIQAELRAVRKDADLTLKGIRAQYGEAIAKQTYTPGIGGAILGSKYRGAATRVGAANKRKLAASRNDAIAPYEGVKSAISQVLDQLDRLKLDLEIRIAKEQ
jgi:hypothetical protein